MTPAPVPCPSACADLFAGAVDLGRIEELVRFCERRMARAADKLAAAETENAEAQAALDRAVAAREAWIAASPDPQLLML